MTEKEKMLNGELYHAFDPQLVKEYKLAKKLMWKFNNTDPSNFKKLRKMIKKIFGKTGEVVEVRPPFYFDYGKNIEVGENFFANYDCVILDVNKVKIGKNCLLAPKVSIYTAGHPLDVRERAELLEYGYPVTIGDDCWIGGNSVINPGVTLGNNVIVASNSVVTKSFGDNLVIGGNPAKIIKRLD